jgi:hypothetical protein
MDWKNIAQRFVWTVIIAFMGAFGAVEVVNMDVTNAAWMAGIVAGLSFVVNLCKELSLAYGDNWLLRVALTFVQATAAALVAVPAFNLSGLKAAAMVGMIAVANVLTLVGRQFVAPKPLLPESALPDPMRP